MEESIMAKKYVVFSAEGSPIRGDQCTSVWDSSISCTIPMSGYVEDTFYNIMVMEGDAAKISAWLAENVGKVQEATKEQCDALGQTIVPPGTEREEEDMENPEVKKVYVAGEFDTDHPENLWTLKE